MLLAIDTSTRYMSLALHDDTTLIAEQTWRAGRQHNVLLAPSTQMMMRSCSVTVQDLTAVAVSIGPGSYTGLRIGVAFAKGMAAMNNLPLVGVTTLDTLAAGQPFHNTRHALIPVVQAGRGKIIAAQYRVKKGRWTAYTEAEITRWDDLLVDLEGSYYITGEVDEKGRAAIEAAQAKDSALTLMSPAYRMRRAGFLAQEALYRLQDSSDDDFSPSQLIPIYLNSSD